MVTGITGMAAVDVVIAIVEVAIITGEEVKSPQVPAADLVVTTAAVVLAFPSPPEGSIILWI